ncbi:MAG: FAD-dependent thymidylate synthase [Candidatus Saccharimonadales bacterium]
MNNSSFFIAIEGSDGSGKGTQFKLLVERLKAEGYDVATYDFPQYENESSYFVREYLNGNYGTAEALGPYTPSLFYALDRFSAARSIAADLAAGKVVVSNRYMGSNMAHQGTKFNTLEERQAFWHWLDQLEFGMLGIPRPDLNLVLLVPAETAQRLVDQKEARSYTDKKRDIHEADLNHLSRAVEVYQQLCGTFQESFSSLDCTKEGELLSIPTINNLIWERVQPMLGKLRKQKKDQNESATVFAPKKSENPYVTKNSNGSYSITKAGREYLTQAVTDTSGDVYMFTDKISNQTVAAAMARLSRRADDMRVTILDEFTEKEGKDSDLLKRVITAFGDDSVQQLTGIHFVVENASNLLTKKLEWGRLAAYLEQSTRYIYFDQKDENGRYKFYTPKTLTQNDTEYYNQQMNKLFDMYSEIVQKLTDYVRGSSSEPEEKRDGAWKAATRAQACDAARVVLPAATTSTVGIFASGQALESLIMHLQSDELAEARTVGSKLLVEGRKVVLTFLERADKPDRGGAWVAHRAQTRAKLAEIVKEKGLRPIKGNGDEPVALTDFWPKNELDVLPHVLYEQSTLSLDELSTEINQWSYTEKEETLKAAFGERLNRRHKPGRALEFVHYNFDLVCDYGIFRDLQRHRIVDALEWQLLTPHYGYEIPKLVSDAGLEDLFESCFDLSAKLYQFLLEKGYEYEAQYATLLGHRMRWKVMLNAREAFHFMELRTSPQGHPGYRKLAKQMYDKIAEVHPIIADGMSFVNQGEDPELARLAAERATQFKLEQLNQ